MRLNDRLKKWTAVLSAFFFLSAQPVWAAPVLSEEYQSEEEPQGFVSAEEAEQSFQNQISEVQSVDQAFNGPTNLTSEEESAPQESILVKFQQTEETDEVSDLALLSSPSVPLPQVESVVLETVETEETQQVASETTSEESDEPQPVAMAETEEAADQTLSNTNEESASTAVIEFAAAEAETSESQTSSSDSNLTVENLTSEEPMLLASLSVVSAPSVLPEAEVTEEAVSDAAAKSVSQQAESAVATELAALMGVSSVGTAAASSSSVGVAESSMIGALPQASSALSQDPPVVFVLGGTIPLEDPLLAGFDGTGGVSPFSTFLEAFQQFFADFNLAPNGLAVGNGINDAYEGSEFVKLLSFIYKTFFGIDVKPGELMSLFSRGTTKDGVELFGSKRVFLLALIVSAFVLPLSGFFPQKGRKGIDLAGARLSNPDAYTINIPLFIPDYVFEALAGVLDPSLTGEDAILFGRESAAASFAEVFSGTAEFTPGHGIFVANKDFSKIKAFQEGSFDFSAILGAVKISLIALPDSINPSLSNADGTRAGEGVLFRIELSKEFIDAIGDLMVNFARANLGPLVNFYRSLGFITGVGPNAPPILLAGLLNVDFGLTEGYRSGLLELIFNIVFGTIILFRMAAPIPAIDTYVLFGVSGEDSFNNNMVWTFFANVATRFANYAEIKKKEQQKINMIKPVTLDVPPTTPKVTAVTEEPTDGARKKAQERKNNMRNAYSEPSTQRQLRQQSLIPKK